MSTKLVTENLIISILFISLSLTILTMHKVFTEVLKAVIQIRDYSLVGSSSVHMVPVVVPHLRM